jgi:acetyl-CoA carboxylase biotin carboxylase subunit
VLVANRGEIAIRVIRACRELGIGCVAVASEADRFSLHARLADEVVEIGPAAAGESYLVAERVIAAAVDTACDAVHPGYGFLAENAAFARGCEEAGLVFIGPQPDVIEEMGLKTRARAHMERAAVPVVPGARLAEDVDEEILQATARSVGFPLLVKASAGGGGKGMRAVHAPEDLLGAVGAARREALSAFGNGEVYLERLLQRPRHIEVQVLGDAYGAVVHLGERECSIQRRHQKIVEESPAPGLSNELRARIHQTALLAARAVGYRGAGTVEMLLDASGEFYFLEMNTRLQVEHPVTEWVTGVDLVVEQIRVAQGEPLGLEQGEIALRGHAIEARLYAEDPADGFLPQTGEVLLFEAPGGPGVRVDSGITGGAEISRYYDPMIAKLSTWAEDRDAARRRMVEALRETVLLGVGNNLAYLKEICEHPAYAAGDTHTSFLEEHLPDWAPPLLDAPSPAPREQALLAAAAAVFADPATRAAAGDRSDAGATTEDPGPWRRIGPLRLGTPSSAPGARAARRGEEG